MEYNNPVASAVAYVSIGLVPVINLVYVVKCRCMKPATRREWSRYRDRASSSGSSRTGSRQQNGAMAQHNQA